MKKAILVWSILVALSCGLGLAIYFLSGWQLFLTLTVIVIAIAFVCAIADYITKNAYNSDERKVKILYVATAFISTWPLLAFVVIGHEDVNAIAATTLTLIGISIRRAMKNC